MSDADPKNPPGMTYPCEFPIKVFILPDEATVERIVGVARAELAEGATLTTARRMSSTGKYLALTLNFTAEDAGHLARMIAAVKADPGVILSL